MTSLSKYSYSPIESTDIRLLKFLKSENNGLSAELHKFSLSPASQPPPAYTALSYVWSLFETEKPLARNSKILIDGKEFLILDSLKDFLEELRTREALLDNSWWWIDSISIDQEDNEEKGKQVALMQAIYRGAGLTVVWLGECSADSDIAMNFIFAISHLMQRFDIGAVEKVLISENYASKWNAFENLLTRRWWTRIWTVQEFVLPRDLSFWCGSKSVSRIEFSRALQMFHNCRHLHGHGLSAFQNSWHRNRVHDWYRMYSTPDSAFHFRMSLVALASYCSNNKASNKRDLLYGLTALTPDIQFVKIDYNLTVEEAFIQFTKSHIQHYESLDIICYAHVHRGDTKSLLPTWVPDWRSRLYKMFGITPVMVSQSSSREIGNLRPPQFVRRDNSAAKYMASGNRKPVYHFEGPSLVVRGFVLDTIDGLGGKGKSELVQPSEPFVASMTSERVLDCLSSVLRCLTLGRSDRYLLNAVIPGNFMEDFLRFSRRAKESNHSEIPEGFQNWFDQNRLFRIHGYPLDSLVHHASLDENRMLGNETRISVHRQGTVDTFSARFSDAVVTICRRLMVGKSGCLGMAPELSQIGDKVCILFGCSVPVILRKTSNESNFEFIGECFVDGYMSGEAVGDDKFQETSFCIS